MGEVSHPRSPLARAVDLVWAHKRLVGACAALTLVVFLIDVFTPLGLAEAMLYSVIVLLSAEARERRLTIAFAAITTVLSGAGFALSAASGVLWVELANCGLTIVLVWLTAGLSLRRLRLEQERDTARREREEALAHIQFLHGLLPICAWCKRIREADGSWVKLESYIAQHSDASFTHSICPDCKQNMVREGPDPPGGDSSPHP